MAFPWAAAAGVISIGSSIFSAISAKKQEQKAKNKAKDARKATAEKMKLSNARIEHLWKMQKEC